MMSTIQEARGSNNGTSTSLPTCTSAEGGSRAAEEVSKGQSPQYNTEESRTTDPSNQQTKSYPATLGILPETAHKKADGKHNDEVIIRDNDARDEDWTSSPPASPTDAPKLRAGLHVAGPLSSPEISLHSSSGSSFSEGSSARGSWMAHAKGDGNGVEDVEKGLGPRTGEISAGDTSGAYNPPNTGLGADEIQPSRLGGVKNPIHPGDGSGEKISPVPSPHLGTSPQLRALPPRTLSPRPTLTPSIAALRNADRPLRQRSDRVVSFAVPAHQSNWVIPRDRASTGVNSPSYPWLMLSYLTTLNPILCLANFFFCLGLLAILTLQYPFHLLLTKFLVNNKPGYYAPRIQSSLSSPLFLHLRIIYQTTRPGPLPEEWDSGRLVLVCLVAPVISIVPYSVGAWGAALMWLYSVLLGDGAVPKEEFYALRFVRKRWEGWVLWALR
ncbi:hypothetical protein DFH27DRAFT_197759 [Peziza echinospora]|nr:hypothetical protein DFH27DRAFT_197759 [Peziza echinospora]